MPVLLFSQSFPQDNLGHLFQRSRQRNLNIGSNNTIDEENRVIRAAVLGKDGVGKTGEDWSVQSIRAGKPKIRVFELILFY